MLPRRSPRRVRRRPRSRRDHWGGRRWTGRRRRAPAGTAREADADPTAHAELVALRAAAAPGGEWRLDACTLGGHPRSRAPCASAWRGLVFGRLRTTGRRVAVGRGPRPPAQPPSRGCSPRPARSCWWTSSQPLAADRHHSTGASLLFTGPEPCPRARASCSRARIRADFRGRPTSSEYFVVQRPKEHASKACEVSRPPWVQIPTATASVRLLGFRPTKVRESLLMPENRGRAAFGVSGRGGSTLLSGHPRRAPGARNAKPGSGVRPHGGSLALMYLGGAGGLPVEPPVGDPSRSTATGSDETCSTCLAHVRYSPHERGTGAQQASGF